MSSTDAKVAGTHLLLTKRQQTLGSQQSTALIQYLAKFLIETGHPPSKRGTRLNSLSLTTLMGNVCG